MKKQNKTKEKKRKGGKGKKIFLIILLILLIAGGVFGYKVYKNGGGIGGLIATTLGHDENTVKDLPKIYCLLLGKSEGLTDTIMLASYDPKTQEAALLSIPRDTFVGESKSNARSWEKINAVYSMQNDHEKGIKNLLKDVQKITGIDVKYYAMVDTKALKVLVDKIGGVTFDVPIDMNYDDNRQGLHIHLKAGEQKLDGDKAEQVVRFRHNNNGTTYPSSYGQEDIGRMKTQRAFLTALAKQTLVPANLTKIPEFLDIAKEYVKTNLDFTAIKDYVPYAVEFNVNNLKTDKLPGTPEKANGWWIYSVDEDKTKEVIKELFFNTPTADENNNDISKTSNIDKKDINIEILNGTGLSTNLSEAVTLLENRGYTIKKTGKTNTTSNTAIINRGEVSEQIENEIKDILKTGTITNGQSSGTTDITIILGTDYIM